MYRNLRSRVRVNSFFSDGFLVQAVLRQDSVLSVLIFIMVLEALSRYISSECPELLYDDDCALVGHFEGLKSKLEARKGALESKGLTVNINKTKMMISNKNTSKVTKCKFSCTVYRKSVHKNSVFGIFCRCWMHKR